MIGQHTECRDTYGPIVVCDPDEMRSEITHGVYTIWKQLCHGREMPSRTDIAPKAFAKFLPHLHLFEVIDFDNFRVRLCGTIMARILGGDTTGAELSASTTTALGLRTLSVLQRVLIAGRPVLINTERGAAPGTQAHSVESIWLPLSEEGRSIRHVLSAASTKVLPEFVNAPIEPQSSSADA